MSSSLKKADQLFAEKKRELTRQLNEQKIQNEVHASLRKYFSEQQFDQNPHLLGDYGEVYSHIKKNSTSKKWIKFAYDFFEDYIKELNAQHRLDLELPHAVLDIKRDKPIVTMSWNADGHEINDLVQQLYNYWELAESCDSFSNEEIVGNIILSAILFGGLNEKAELNALLEHLRNPVKVRHYKDLNILFLESHSNHYGDIFIDEYTVRKSRNFIPDPVTRLWLIHFTLRDIRHVHLPVEGYLEYIFRKIKKKFKKNSLSHLLQHARYNWLQLPNVDIDPALSECLIGNLLSCGLPEQEFERFVQPKFKYKHELTTEVIHQSKNLPPQTVYLHHEQDALKDVLKIHKDLLKIIRLRQTDAPIYQLMIDYCMENAKLFNEYSKRITLWLISLFKPPQEDIDLLAQRFDCCATIFAKIISNNSQLAKSSIYTYYTRIGEPWLIYSLQYQFSEDDEETRLQKIYAQIYQNNCIAESLLEDTVKKSAAQIVKTLKRFHQFQEQLFDAPAFTLETLDQQTRPRTRIISPVTFQLLIKKLQQAHLQNIISQHDYENLSLIYTLAYRTGMRINEMIGLRIKDTEGLNRISLLVKPYGSEKIGNEHRLKTDSAQRSVPVYCLLKASEYQQFHQYVVKQRLTKKPNDYLFSQFNENKKLSQHMLTAPFKNFMDQLFKQHHYTFHSFRHSAANHLALIFKCDYHFLSDSLTDYTEVEYNQLRAELLRNSIDQNHWIIIAHLLGHLEPIETFKSYIHVAYFIAGYQFSKYRPLLSNGLVKKMLGISNSTQELHFLKSLNDQSEFNFEMHATTLCKLLLNNQEKWIASNAHTLHAELEVNQTQEHCIFDYFVATPESKIDLDLFYKALCLLELYKYDTERVAQELCLSHELIKYWYDNAIQLKQLKSRKNNPRLFHITELQYIKPSMIDTNEDLLLVTHFFNYLQACYQKSPENIRYVLEFFINHVTASHTGLHSTRKNIQNLEKFYYAAKDLFPANMWHLLGIDMVNFLNKEITPNLLKLAKANQKLEGYPTTKENNARLQLYSLKQGKALPAFKFCLHLACIGRPAQLQLEIK